MSPCPFCGRNVLAGWCCIARKRSLQGTAPPTMEFLDRVTPEAHRAALTRALTAQAWLTACAVFCEHDFRTSLTFGDLGYSEQDLARKLARQIAPADLATEILGGEP